MLPLLLLGTGHVFELRAAVEAVIAQERPNVVALELDPDRYQGLLARRAGHQPTAAERARAPRLYRVLARFQDSVADAFGVQAGMEMLAAADAAQRVSATLALIDRSAQDAVRRALAAMRLRERLRLFWAAATSLLPARRQRSVEAELARYHRDPQAYIDEFGRQFPTLKRVLIDERNQHMADELRKAVGTEAHVVAVVGDGHVPGLLQLLADLKPRAMRLPELQALGRSVVSTASGRAGGLSFGFDGTSLEAALRRA